MAGPVFLHPPVTGHGQGEGEQLGESVGAAGEPLRRLRAEVQGPRSCFKGDLGSAWPCLSQISLD